MAESELNPAVKQFKTFVAQHPGIIGAVRSNEKSLQSFFEEWSILGAEHEQWNAYRQAAESGQGETVHSGMEGQSNGGTTEGAEQTSSSTTGATSGETLGMLLSMVKKMNIQDLQGHLGQFSSLLSNVQNVMSTFQKPSNSSTSTRTDRSFSFRRD